MERKTPQKILLWNDCHVSYIWFKEGIFLFGSSHNENQNQEYSTPLKLLFLSVEGTENYSFSGRILNWFRDCESRTCSRLHLLQNKKIKKVLFLVLLFKHMVIPKIVELEKQIIQFLQVNSFIIDFYLPRNPRTRV